MTTHYSFENYGGNAVSLDEHRVRTLIECTEYLRMVAHCNQHNIPADLKSMALYNEATIEQALIILATEGEEPVQTK